MNKENIMKRTEKKRKLGLMAELVRTLATADLIAVHGGAIDPTRNICDTAAKTCLC